MRFITLSFACIALLFATTSGSIISKFLETPAKLTKQSALASAAAARRINPGMGMGMGGNPPAPVPPPAMGMGMGMAPCVPTANATDLSAFFRNDTHGNSLSIFNCEGNKLLAVVPPGVANYSVCLPPDLRFSFTVGGGDIRPEVIWAVTDLTNSGVFISALSAGLPPFSGKSRTCLNCPANTVPTGVEVHFYLGTINSFQFSDCNNNTVFNLPLADYSSYSSQIISFEALSACLPNNGGTIRSNTGADFFVGLYTLNGEAIFEAESNGNGVASGGCGGV